ncbi:MAG TPA: sulfatase, partial [Acidobacteria bacterium]|nr:sulfatase [Acidobacteriota bacterium]
MSPAPLLTAAAAFLILDLLLTLPAGAGAGSFPPLPLPAGELLLLAALALAAGPRWRRAVTVLATALLLPAVLLLAAANAVRLQFGRELVLVTDLRLLPVLGEVVRDVLPRGIGLALFALALLLVLLTVASSLLLFPKLAALPARLRRRLAVVALLLPPALLAVDPRLLAFEGIAEIAGQIRHARVRAAELARLRRELARDPLLERLPGPPLAGLDGVDVLVLFVESYGMRALEREPFRTPVRARLQALEAALAARGFAALSGRLLSPTVGGQSWLAHATLLSGVRIGDQAAYELLLASRRRSLARLFAAAGHRTVLLAPAILRPWPEARFYGFARIYVAADFAYAGPRPGWVTVPDQFTLHVLARRELEPRPRPPVFATVALISSHSPFAPVPRILPWRALESGGAFARALEDAPPPAAVWRSVAAIRRAYAKALSYALASVTAFLRDRVGPC